MSERIQPSRQLPNRAWWAPAFALLSAALASPPTVRAAPYLTRSMDVPCGTFSATVNLEIEQCGEASCVSFSFVKVGQAPYSVEVT